MDEVPNLDEKKSLPRVSMKSLERESENRNAEESLPKVMKSLERESEKRNGAVRAAKNEEIMVYIMLDFCTAHACTL